MRRRRGFVALACRAHCWLRSHSQGVIEVAARRSLVGKHAHVRAVGMPHPLPHCRLRARVLTIDLVDCQLGNASRASSCIDAVCVRDVNPMHSHSSENGQGREILQRR